MKKTIFIEGMSCNHCKMRVENTLKELEGITSAEVELENKLAKIVLSQDVSNEVLTEALDDIGFDVTNIEG
jgi:Cu+-exporting ATPase